jgi:hypothetical protein
MSLKDQLGDSYQAADNLFVLVKSWLCEHSVPQFIAVSLAGLFAAILFAIGSIYAVITSTAISIAAPVASAILKIISDTRKEGLPALGALCADSLSEFLGVEVDSADIPDGTGKNGNLKQATAIGSKVHDLLISEFVPDGKVTPESAEKAARAFSGFNVRFAVANSFISMFTELLSDGHLEQFRELGVEVAQNLSLGRLHRGALKPLIDNTITKPYDLLLRSRYRPDRLTDTQYVHAFHRGDLTEDQLKKQLEYKGYTDDDITRLIREITGRLTEAELARLVRYGDITIEQAITELNASGIPKATAERRFHATDEARADSIVSTYVNKLESQYIEGDIELAEFNTLLDKAPLSELEKQWERNYVGIVKEHPRKRLTLAQVRKSFIDGISDLDYWDRFLEAEGYSEEDQLILTYQLLLDAKKASDAADAKAKIKAKKKVTPSGGTAPLSDATVARLDRVTLPAQLSAPGDGEAVLTA